MRLSTKTGIGALVALTAAALSYGVSRGATPSAHNSVGANRPSLQHQITPSVEENPVNQSVLFTSIPDCRIVNTATTGGRIGNGDSRAFFVSGTTGFTGQGGAATGCGISADATAISARVTGYRALATGSFLAYPTGTPTALATLYYTKGANSTTGATLQLGPGTAKRLSVKNLNGPAELDIDVTGYYSPQIEALLNSGGGIFAGTSPVLSSDNTSTGQYTVTIDRDLTGCNVVAGISGGNYYVSAFISGNHVSASTWELDGTTITPTNLFWHMTVTC
jgi:hypothetical protein